MVELLNDVADGGMINSIATLTITAVIIEKSFKKDAKENNFISIDLFNHSITQPFKINQSNNTKTTKIDSRVLYEP